MELVEILLSEIERYREEGILIQPTFDYYGYDNTSGYTATAPILLVMTL